MSSWNDRIEAMLIRTEDATKRIEDRQRESEGVVVEIERSDWPDKGTVDFTELYTPEEIGLKPDDRRVKFRLTRIEGEE